MKADDLLQKLLEQAREEKLGALKSCIKYAKRGLFSSAVDDAKDYLDACDYEYRMRSLPFVQAFVLEAEKEEHEQSKTT